MIRVPLCFDTSFTELPTIAIDLSAAYSDGRKGAGFSFWEKSLASSEGESLTQTKALERTIAKLQEHQRDSPATVNMILEAPLSGAVSSAEAFLDARLRSIEKPSCYPSLQLAGQPRPWNVNAGASTALMALMFLQALAAKIPEQATINLFEGFWSWGEKPSQHHIVAKGLIESLRAGGNRIVKLPEVDFKYITALQLLGIEAENQEQPPLIVFGNSSLADAYQPS